VRTATATALCIGLKRRPPSRQCYWPCKECVDTNPHYRLGALPTVIEDKEILVIWEEAHFPLAPTLQEEFLHRPELSQIRIRPRSEVQAAIKKHRWLVDAVSELNRLYDDRCRKVRRHAFED
jgi:hypothetical protein